MREIDTSLSRDLSLWSKHLVTSLAGANQCLFTLAENLSAFVSETKQKQFAISDISDQRKNTIRPFL